MRVAGDTLPQLLSRIAREHPQAPVLRHKRRGVWRTWTWRDVQEDVRSFALALLQIGLPRGAVVSVLSENRPEWLLADLGAQAAGCAVHGLHPTWSAAGARHVLEQAGSHVLVVENAEQARKALGCGAGFLRVVVLDERDVAFLRDESVVTWSAFLATGAQRRREASGMLDVLLERGQGADDAWLLESAGQAGSARLGAVTQQVVLAHVERAAELVEPVQGEACFSFIPLAQPAERAMVFAAIAAGSVVHFAEQPATVLNDLEEVQPHWLHAWPRFWEKQQSRIEATAMSAPRAARAVYAAILGCPQPLWWSRWPARNLRRRLGLVRARAAFCSGDDLSAQVVHWFAALGVSVTDVHSMWQGVAPADAVASGEFAHEPMEASVTERELRACHGIADALVFEPAPHRRVALLRPERDFLLAWAQEQQLPFTSFDDLLRLPAALELLDSEVRRINASMHAAEPVSAFALITEGQDAEDDAVSATLRLRRSVVGSRHAALLRELAQAAGRVEGERGAAPLASKGSPGPATPAGLVASSRAA